MMNYPAAAVGAAIGMMAAILVFSNAWRIRFLPKGYDFIHEFGKSLVRSDNKRVTYTSRFVMGIIFHPIIFVFVWGRLLSAVVGPLGFTLAGLIGLARRKKS